ncbi:MAG TPA: thiosulfate sulfurtransferase GlpE [Azonexus sp.]
MSTAEPRTFRCLSAAEAAHLIRDPEVAVFDVRDLASYRSGHVAGAAHLSEDRLLAWIRRLARETPVVIYCYHGNASKAYAQMFADLRYTNVVSVDGGYPALAAALG